MSLYADGLSVDLTLPAAVPVAALMPSVLEILATEGGFGSAASLPTCYQLSCPGAPALDSSKTLQQNAVHDGTLLILTRSSTELPAPHLDDEAEAVSSTIAAAARPWNRRAAGLAGAVAATWLAALGAALLVRSSFAADGSRHANGGVGVAAVTGCLALSAATIAHRVYRDKAAGLTLGLLATGYFAVDGFLAVPDGPAAPNALLAAMAAGAASMLALRLSGCGAITFTAVSCFALTIAGAAFAAVITTAPLRVIGPPATLLSLALSEVSARLAMAWAGLSPRLPGTDGSGRDVTPDPEQLRLKAMHADDRLTSLIVASACAAATGAICTAISACATGGPRSGAVVFATVTGAVLLLRARSHPDFTRTLVLLGTGTATLSTAFVVAADAASQHPGWLAAGPTLLAAAALYLGFVTPHEGVSPVTRRSIELLEYGGLAAIVPLACWTCGFYSAARGVRLP